MKFNLLKTKLTIVVTMVMALGFNAFSQDPIILPLIEDTYVAEKFPNDVLNAEGDYGVALDETNSDTRETYLKFDISGLTGVGKVTSVDLNIMSAQKTDAGWVGIPDLFVNVFGCEEIWSETELTWASKPETGIVVLAEANIQGYMENGYSFTGVGDEKTLLAKYINDALAKGKTTITFVFKGKDETPASRIWISPVTWKPAKCTVVMEVEAYVDKIVVSGTGNANSITTNNGTLQMIATVTPAEAPQQVKWVLENSTGSASISSTGLITAKTNGTVTVKATSTDGSNLDGKATITISGQTIDKDKVWNAFNLLKNWNFTEGDNMLADWANYVETGSAPEVRDGVVYMASTKDAGGQQWKYQFDQNKLSAEANVPYILSFKSWAEGDRPCTVDFEDTGANNYNRYGATPDAESMNTTSASGRSEWIYQLSTLPTWFTFHVTFDQMVATTDQKLTFHLAMSDQPVYLDSVLLVKASEYAIITSAPKSLSNSMKVYPNPVNSGSKLNVSLTSVNAKVAIYNTLGQKMMEKVATGNIAKFDVSSLSKGMYIVKLDDGTSQKFLKQ